MEHHARSKNQLGIFKEVFWEPLAEGRRAEAVVYGYCHPREPWLAGTISEVVSIDDETHEVDVRSVTIRSTDNGKTWQVGDGLPSSPANATAVIEDCLDPNRGVYMQFLLKRVLAKEVLAGRHCMTFSRALYRMSFDGAATFGVEQPLIQAGREYHPDHPARGVWYGRNGGSVDGKPLVLRDGSVLAPFVVWPWNAQARRLSTETVSGFFRGTWSAGAPLLPWELSDYLRSPERRRGSFMASCAAELVDGSVLAIMRSEQQFDGPLNFSAVSRDGGRTWSDPERLTYDDGGVLCSHSSASRMFRSAKNGRLYWVGNLLPYRADDYAGCATEWENTGRRALHIAEVDEEARGIRRETVTVIDESSDPEDPLEYSNFGLYEDRETGDAVVTLCEKSALPLRHRSTPGYRGPFMTRRSFTASSYRYTIRIPDA